MTNHERIKNLSIEEMAVIMACPYIEEENTLERCNIALCIDQEAHCNKCCENWLKEEAK